MRNLTYYWLAALAYIRGWLGVRDTMTRETCTAGLNGKGEARTMYVKHNWVPYIYRRIKGTSYLSRTFITDASA